MCGLELLHIGREAVSNCLRQPRAHSAFVRLARKDDELRFEVVDENIGFDEAQAAQSGGCGRGNIRTRARELGGAATVDASPSAGSRITVRFPLPAPT